MAGSLQKIGVSIVRRQHVGTVDSKCSPIQRRGNHGRPPGRHIRAGHMPLAAGRLMPAQWPSTPTDVNAVSLSVAAGYLFDASTCERLESGLSVLCAPRQGNICGTFVRTWAVVAFASRPHDRASVKLASRAHSKPVGLEPGIIPVDSNSRRSSSEGARTVFWPLWHHERNIEPKAPAVDDSRRSAAAHRGRSLRLAAAPGRRPATARPRSSPHATRRPGHAGIGPPPLESASLREGDQLGQFLLQKFVGGGGMGVVFRALDTTLNREVAVKVLSRDQSADEETLAPLSQRGPIGRSAQPRQYRPRALRRRRPGRPLHRLRVHRRHQHSRPRRGARPAAAGRSRQLHLPDRRGAGARQPAGGHPSRHQALERADHRRRAGQAGRHGPGAAAATWPRPTTSRPAE